MSLLITYTAVFGNIGDTLHPPKNQSEGSRFVAFVDDPSKHQGELNGWELRGPQWEQRDKRKQARRHKCMAHELFPDAKITLWVDGCLTPTQSVVDMAGYLLNGYDLCTFEHQERNCVYQEVEACIRLKKDAPDLIRSQVARYRAEGYPYHNGLAETTAVLRRHTPQVQKFNELWWEEICNNCVRDQISFDYVCWRLGVAYSHLEGTRTSSPHFIWRPHR